MDYDNLKTLCPIDLDLAIKLTQNWVKYASLDLEPIPKTGFKRSFRIAKEDLEELSKMQGYDGIRIYIGKNAVDHLGDIRIILTAVTDDDRDIIDENKPKIFDFSMPCPPTCADKDSPLYTGARKKE